MPLHSQNDDLVTEPPQKKVAIEAHKTSSPHNSFQFPIGISNL